MVSLTVDFINSILLSYTTVLLLLFEKINVLQISQHTKNSQLLNRKVEVFTFE